MTYLIDQALLVLRYVCWELVRLHANDVPYVSGVAEDTKFEEVERSRGTADEDVRKEDPRVIHGGRKLGLDCSRREVHFIMAM